jgi:competence protein ComEC
LRASPHPPGQRFPGSFDFAFNSYFAGIGAVGFFMGPPVAGPSVPATVGDAAGQALRELRESIAFRMRTVIGGDAGAVAAAMTVSDRRAISEETDEAFRITGLAHILSISGLHMSLAAGIMFQGLRYALALLPGIAERVAVKKYAAAGALLSSTAYLMISGGIVSAQRSWIMVAIMLIAVIMDRPALTMRNVALAGFIILALSPSAVVSPGFQMSFAATAALIAAYGFWQRQSLGPALRRFTGEGLVARCVLLLGGLALTSLVAGLATGIFSAHHFHRMSGYGMIANVAAMPIISLVVMPMGVVSLLAMPFGLDIWPLTAMGWGLEAVLAIAHDVAAMGEDFATGRLPFVATALLTAALAILVFTRTRLAALAAVPLLLAVPLIWTGAGAGRPHLLISEDGRLVARLQGDGLATNRTQPPSFIYEQWASALRADAHVAPFASATRLDPNLLTAADLDMDLNDAVVRAALDADIAQARDDQFTCQRRAWCILALAGMAPVVTVEEPAFLGAACDRASIVIIAIPLRLESCRSGAVLYTARTLRRTGAIEIYLDQDRNFAAGPGSAFADEQAGKAADDGNAGFEAVRAIDGLQRPWRVNRAYDWRSRSFID